MAILIEMAAARIQRLKHLPLLLDNVGIAPHLRRIDVARQRGLPIGRGATARTLGTLTRGGAASDHHPEWKGDHSPCQGRTADGTPVSDGHGGEIEVWRRLANAVQLEGESSQRVGCYTPNIGRPSAPTGSRTLPA